MKAKKFAGIIIALMVLSAMFFSTITPVGVNEVSADNSEISIAYIYSSDVASADIYKSLLESDYSVSLVHMDDIVTTDFSVYTLLIVGNDTGFDYNWGEPESVEVIQSIEKPIIGLGFGGSCLFQQLGLSINWGNGWLGSENSIYIVEPHHVIFNFPHIIDIPEDGIIQLYSSTDHIGEYAPVLSAEAILLGRETGDVEHYPLVQERQAFLWGFTASPETMTQLGEDLFLNVVNYIAGLPTGGAPDFIITDMWSDNGKICYQIMNIGDAVVPEEHHTALLIDGGYRVSDLVNDGLEPGERLTRCFDYDWEATPPDDTIVVWADYDDDVTESNETNNRREETWKYDTLPPQIISGPSVSEITQNMAVISWTTDEDSDSSVKYSMKAGRYASSETDTSMVSSHNINLIDLEPSTTYNFTVQSTDSNGNTVRSRSFTFETLAIPDASNPVVSIIDPGVWQDTTIISADASDDTGVGKVEFYVDGKLVFTDYSAPYGFYLDTNKYENGNYNLTSKAYDLSGNSFTEEQAIGVANIKDVTAPEVTIISPNQGDYISGKVTVTANLKDDTGLLNATLRVDGDWFGYWYPATEKVKETTIDFTLDTLYLDNGKHRIAIQVYDDDKYIKEGIDYVDVVVNNTPPPLPANLTIKRNVTRTNNYFTIDLTVENVGGEKATDIQILDYLQLFQPMFNNTATAEYVAEFKPELSSWRMDIISKVDIDPGQKRTYTYYAVPVMVYPDSLTPLIGGDKYTLPNGSTRIWYQTESSLNTLYKDVDLLFIPYASYDSAVKTSDYLIVTSPANLLRFNSATDVNELLSSMAELAKLKNGVLGYLDVPSSFPRNYEAHDGFATGDVIEDTKDEVVIGDIDEDKIYIYYISGKTKCYSPTACYTENWVEYTKFKCGYNEEGFDAGDRLAVGDLPGGTKAEIIMADASADYILVYEKNSLKTSFKLNFNLEAYDGLAAGDVNGDSKDEIIIADRSANKVYIYNIFGIELSNFNKDYEIHDGLASGDVLGDTKDEVIIADRSDDKIYIFSATSLISTFNRDFEEGDGLSIGNAIYTWPTNKEEIIIGDYSKDEVFVYRGDGAQLGSFDRDFEKFDGLATGCVAGGFSDDIVIADRSEDSIDFHTLGETSSDKHLLQDLIKAELKEESEESSFFVKVYKPYAAGEWSKKLKSDWISNGYLLIVGEPEIIPAWAGESFGKVLTTKGNVNLRADVTDYPYASTYDAMIKPELSIGRIVGNSADELKIPIETSINVAKELPGWGFDRSLSFCVSGYSKGLNGKADYINFKSEAMNVALTLKNKGVDGIVMFTPDYTIYYSTGVINEPATKTYIRTMFFTNTPEKDVVFLSAHGDPGNWDVINKGDVMLPTLPFGSTNPFIYAAACSTGAYFVDFSIVEAFLLRGAGIYYGATKWGLGTHSWIHNKFFSEWDAGESVGLAAKQLKRSIGDLSSKEKYYSAIYHVFGDPKFGSEGPPASSTTSEASTLLAEPSSSVNIVVPDYEVSHINGEDYVTIPGGGVYIEHGLPVVPYYQVFYDYPKGYQIQDVVLTDRSDPITSTGFNIPICIEGIGSIDIDSIDYPDLLEGIEWWPDETFSWNTFESPDTTTLVINIFPFDYNHLTTDARFYKNYSFDIDGVVSSTEITRLETDRPVYELGDEVSVEVEFNDGEEGEIPPSGKDVVISGVFRKDSSDEIVSGLMLRTLKDFRGKAAFSSLWDSTGFEAGYYSLELELRDTEGTLLDRRITNFRLGISQGEITQFTATPEHFNIGDDIDISLTFDNTGSTNISGSTVMKVKNEAGEVLEEFRHEFTDLASSESLTFDSCWDTAGVTEGSYSIIGLVFYDARVTDTASLVVYTSLPPVANAGPDQVVERTSLEGAEVILDGSGSYSPDGKLLTYQWTWAGDSVIGVSPSVVLPMGMTTVTLTVSDGVLSGTDTVDIYVIDSTPPEIDIEVPIPDQALQDGVTYRAMASDLSGVAGVYFYIREPGDSKGVPIGFEGLAASLESGNAESGVWEYQFDTTQLPDGYYVVLAKAVDYYSNEGWSDVIPFSIRNWAIVELLPNSKSNKAGRTMPVKFSLRIAESVDPSQPFVYNEELEIRIYNEADPNAILQTSLYGGTSKDYRIDSAGELYITNFKTAKKPAQYVVEIWRTSMNFLIGSFTFETVK